MVDPTRCGEIADALAEVATGAASGPDRARVLAHLTECPDCRRELEELTRVADEVLLVAPEHDPPAGFEGAVLARIAALTSGDSVPPAPQPSPTLGPADHEGEPDAVVTPMEPRRRWRRVLPYAAAAAVAGLVGAGVVWQATSDERDVAASYRDTLDVANGRYFHAAPITDDSGTQVGHVFLYQGEPSWVFTVLDDTVPAGEYDIVVSTDEWVRTVASCDSEGSGCGSGATVDANIFQIDLVQLVAADDTTFTADLADNSPP